VFANNPVVATLIDLAFQEDLGLPYRDVTTEYLFGKDGLGKHSRAVIRSKHQDAIIFCGQELVELIITRLDPEASCKFFYHDGQTVAPEQEILSIDADARALLMAERTILNFLRPLSAIASLTAIYLQAVAQTSLKILDTRKTTPGQRVLEKYAVACGGGVNHRMGLYDALMVKDTHVDALGGMEQALTKLPVQQTHGLPVIVEARNAAEVRAILSAGQHKVQRILLDNMSPTELSQQVKLIGDRFETEASGNISLENIRAVAETGVQYASVGRLTYAAGQVDLSMNIQL
jgi:nicotinate-nucleotide pyrophosphorylase (carboxylating)